MSLSTNSITNKLLIIGITPHILENGLIWFEKNEKRITKAHFDSLMLSRGKPSFWQKHSIILEKGGKIMMSEFMRKLAELGYEKYQTISLPGEFSQQGGTVSVFPINSKFAVRIEFFGNSVEAIVRLELENTLPETPLKKIIETKRREVPNDLSMLEEGDYLVHLDHGIGRFIKTEICGKPGIPHKKCYILEYAAGDKLTVPETVSYKLSPYVGFQTPTIYRLGGNLWHNTKRRAKEDIIKTAKELLELYARRETAKRRPYENISDAEEAMAQEFEFEETEDQKKAVNDVTRDMTKETPMDRLICGDVGFGKTEIALRAAIKAALSGRQTALVTPTTILAWQHFETFKKRFSKFPIEVVLLSRVQTKSEAKETIEKLKRGEADIVIGTHRILQKDVGFYNLGLLIIDEEQRFGVKQKEKLKNLRENIAPVRSRTRDKSATSNEVDVLSLSATPIPRTLYFSLSGLKDITNIQTPPAGRLPIKTYALPRSRKIIRSVISYELERGGQIYYLHNRISTIDAAREKIRKLSNDARISIAHANLPDKQLIDIIKDFREKKTDILVATTIIENGLDLSNVNTLIVEDSTRLGLSQAHQLRGRIGRGDKQAFAYFLYSKKKLTDTGKRRLETLQKYQNLGAGYEIALRDLEIRGAGNLLGREQSGTINKIGLNLYVQMLNSAVEELREY